MQYQSSSSPDNKKRRFRLNIVNSTVRAKNTLVSFNHLFEKYFIKEENQKNLKKYLIELFHDLAHFSSNEEKGVSYETFIFFLNMPSPISSNIFKLLDKDKNSYLNIEEFVFGLYDIYGTTSFNKLANFVFNLYDTDRNGLISKEDMHLILSYLPLERNLRNKFFHKDYYNISYNDISRNQKFIEKTLNNIFQSKNSLNLESFITIIQKKNSDIFVTILLYLYEARPFNNEVLNIYSYTNYDYFSENKNNENFKSVNEFFGKMKKDKRLSIINKIDLFETQNIEEPTYEFIKDLNIRRKFVRTNQKNLTFSMHSVDTSKKNKTNRSLSIVSNIKKMKKNSFLYDMKLNRNSFSKKLSSGIIFNIKRINTGEKSVLNINDLYNLSSLYEGYIFKITNKGQLKTYYLKLIKHDLFYFKSKDDKFHIGMHHLTNNIVLAKNKKQKYKANWLFSLSIINQDKKHTFYFNKEDEYIHWYLHLQKAVWFRKIDDVFTLGEKIKSDKTQILRNIRYRENLSDYHNMNNNIYEGKKYICTQILKAGKNFQNKLNESIFNQISAFKICYHKNFCKLVDIFHDEKYFYIITEKNSEINILEYLRNLGIHNPFKEEEKICEIIHQLLIAVYYLHKMGILHRNIKPDSIVPNQKLESSSEFDSNSESSSSSNSNNNSKHKETISNIYSYEFSNIKLLDLSLSKFLNVNEKIKEPYGTVGYLSPEMLSEHEYDLKIDEWSIGIVTYLLLCGKLPFSDEYSEREIARQTIHETLSFQQPKWEKISKEAKDFVNKLLIKDPKKRMNVKDALIHPWIKKYYPLIVQKRMNSISTKSTNSTKNTNIIDEDNYEFEAFSSPIDEFK